MSDLQKLSNIINSLEEQAKQVTEFSSLLSGVNNARVQIESSKQLIEEVLNKYRQLSIDNESSFNSISERIQSLEKAVEYIIHIQSKMSNEISSLDILSPRQFQEILKEKDKAMVNHFNKLEQNFESLAMAQKNESKKLLILFVFATATILGAIAFFGVR